MAAKLLFLQKKNCVFLDPLSKNMMEWEQQLYSAMTTAADTMNATETDVAV